MENFTFLIHPLFLPPLSQVPLLRKNTKLRIPNEEWPSINNRSKTNLAKIKTAVQITSSSLKIDEKDERKAKNTRRTVTEIPLEAKEGRYALV